MADEPFDFDRADEDRLALAGAYDPMPDDIMDRLSADRAAYVPDDPTPEELYLEDVAEEYRREAIADTWGAVA